MKSYQLTRDGWLRLDCAEQCVPLVQKWLHSNATTTLASLADAVIEVRDASTSFVQLPDPFPGAVARVGTAECTFAGKDAWIRAAGARAHVDGSRTRARVQLNSNDEASDVSSVLNWVCVLMLAHARRYLIHSAALIAPDGTAVLIAGDARAGKTTTSVNLARAGWRMLADDHVVVKHSDGGWLVEGWPRVMHVDKGYAEGVPSGQRDDVVPGSLGEERTSEQALLGALLLPSIAKAQTVTSMRAAAAAAAFEILSRQAAWCLADPLHAREAFTDLARIASLPAQHLDLALDTFAAPERLAALLDAHIMV